MVISVIDNGFNKKHYNCINELIIHGERYSEDLHGTACIKTIDKNMTNGTIISISAYNTLKIIDDVTISTAIKKAIEIKSNIITISMGCFSFSKNLVDAIISCEQKDIIVLAAQDHLNRVVYPACLKNVYAVDSYKGNCIIYDKSFYVPRITTFLSENENHIQSFSGSSIACAYMAANISNLLVKFQPEKARNFIENYYGVEKEKTNV